MQVKLVSCTPRPIEVMAEAAAVCYDAQPGEWLVEHCLDSGHLSIAEFAQFHFSVSGISRVCSHQLVRKRIASYAQQSQRAHDSVGFCHVMPPSVAEDRESQVIFNNAMDYVQRAYDRLRERGVPPEDARFVLPNACATNIHISMNGHSLIDFCNQRLCHRAQWEIRGLARRMRDLVEEKCELLARYMVSKCDALGYCPEKNSCGRRGNGYQRLP